MDYFFTSSVRRSVFFMLSNVSSGSYSLLSSIMSATRRSGLVPFLIYPSSVSVVTVLELSLNLGPSKGNKLLLLSDLFDARVICFFSEARAAEGSLFAFYIFSNLLSSLASLSLPALWSLRE